MDPGPMSTPGLDGLRLKSLRGVMSGGNVPLPLLLRLRDLGWDFLGQMQTSEPRTWNEPLHLISMAEVEVMRIIPFRASFNYQSVQNRST
jgi:hypothetical protein